MKIITNYLNRTKKILIVAAICALSFSVEPVFAQQSENYQSIKSGELVVSGSSEVYLEPKDTSYCGILQIADNLGLIDEQISQLQSFLSLISMLFSFQSTEQ